MRQDAPRSELHHDLLGLCAQCLKLNPSERCSMSEVVEKLSRILRVGEAAGNVVKKQQDHDHKMWKLHTWLGKILYRELTKETADFVRARDHLDAAVEGAAAVYGVESLSYAASLNNLASLLLAQVSF